MALPTESGKHKYNIDHFDEDSSMKSLSTFIKDHAHIHRALARGGQYTTPTIGKTEREFLKQNPEYTKVRVPGEVLHGQLTKGPFGRPQSWGGTITTPDSWKIVPK
jgi:hypothetical protein